MKTLQVYDPPMCCSSGVCGPVIDPNLVSFAAMLSQLGSRGLKIERYNLAQQPMAFMENTAVKAVLDKEGPEALPLIFLEGKVMFKGRYPTHEERPSLFHAAVSQEETVSS